MSWQVVPLIWAIFVAMAVLKAIRRRTAASEAARKSALEGSPAERLRQTVEAFQREEAETLAAGWAPPTGPTGAPVPPNIRPVVFPTGHDPVPFDNPPPLPADSLSDPASDVELASLAAPPASSAPPLAETASAFAGPQVVELPLDLQQRALELMKQHYEVGAVRLVCDETGAGILDAQKTVRTLAGLPTP